MQTEQVLTTEDQAQAVQDAGFLGQFFKPASPSAVAKKLSMPANLVHHHAQRHAALGLLQVVRREGGKVFYGLSARTFRVSRTLLPAGEPGGHAAATLLGLQERFLEAYRRSDRLANDHDPDWDIHSFGDRETPPAELPVPAGVAAEAHPAHLQTRTLSLSAASYQKLVRKIADLLQEAEFERRSDTTPCTLAFLGMDGPLQPGSQDSRHTTSFISPSGAEDG